MGNNLIHNYLNNVNSAQSVSQNTKSERSYFGVPSVSSTLNSFDAETDKLIKPLDGKGHLVNGDLVHMPKEFVRDTVYTTKALVDGARGKANDHQLGKLNDLGLKLGGVAIAAYLMTRRATPKTKMMEFIGLGAFLASMSLWPKIALEIPSRIIHGFNFRKQYIDDQGRKKYVSQDPNYIPFDLYKGDKKSEDLDVIGDRAGIKRDIPNRHEAVKDHIRKVSVQNNTLWMLTAGIATPLMTALACNKAEPFVGKFAENYSNKKVNAQIDKADEYLSGRMDAEQQKLYESKVLKITSPDGKQTPNAVEKMVEGLKGKTILTEDIANISNALAEGFDAEMKDAARADIENLIGGQKYIANSESAERLSSVIHSTIAGKDANLASKITPEQIKLATEQGMIRGAVRDMLTEVGVDVIDPSGKFSNVSTNFKCREVGDIDFFRVTEETKNMSPVDRLAHNIKSIVMKVNNSNRTEDFIPGMSDLECNDRGLKSAIDAKLQAKSEEIAKSFYEGSLAIGEGRENYVRQSINKLYKENAPRGPKYDKIFASVSDAINAETSSHRGYVITDKAADTIAQTSRRLAKFNALDKVLSETSHFKLEKASETLVANSWAEVSEGLVKALKFTDKEIERASKDKNYSNQLFAEKLNAVCSDEKSYKEFIKGLAEKMVQLDEKIDAPNQKSSGSMMGKVEAGITKNCTEAGEQLGSLGMDSMKEKMLASKSSKFGVNAGSIMSSKLERLHSRIEGVHSSYMRLLQTAEFFHRAQGYEKEVAANGGNVTEAIAKKYGFTQNSEVNKEIIEKGKGLLLDAHTNKFYTKMGLHNNPDFFKTLLWSVYRPNNGSEWNANWSSVTESTIGILDNVKSPTDSTLAPRRVFEGVERKSLGQKLKEHMNQMYNSFGSIERGVLQMGTERAKVDGGVSIADARASKRFDLLGKAPTDLLHDTLKQKFNSNKWLKTFAPILGVTYGVTLLAQFFFGKKDPDVKA